MQPERINGRRKVKTGKAQLGEEGKAGAETETFGKVLPAASGPLLSTPVLELGII